MINALKSILCYFIILLCCNFAVNAQLNNKKIISAPSSIPPNHANIVGTIIFIDTLRSDETKPTRALVQIDTVKGYGMAFPTLFSHEERIMINFSQLSGLCVGSKFSANVRGMESMMVENESQKIIYTVNYYKRLRK